MMRWHRLCAALSIGLLIYILGTGAGIQFADMRALVTHAPATDPDMLMMRQHVFGTPNYAVVSAPDYSAPPLPATLDLPAAIQHAATVGRAAVPGADLRLVEVRTAEGKLAGHVQMGSKDLIFDLTSGAALPAADLPPAPPAGDIHSTRDWFKFFHQSRFLGHFGTLLNGFAGIALSILLVTGLIHYIRLYQARAKMGRASPMWRGGDWWRKLHRWTAICAAIFIVWIVVTGLLLSADNIGGAIGALTHGRPAGPNSFDGDFSSPLGDQALAPMTRVSLDAFHKGYPGVGVKVFRLRYFAGYPQGVVVAADEDTSQLVFNAASGAPMTMSEPGYPATGFPSGWERHQWLKRVHRGDVFGMTGRWLDTIGALALMYLTVSGMVMYAQLWTRRSKSGRTALIWR